jgi:Suppressor of fused protein (SUFU)
MPQVLPQDAIVQSVTKHVSSFWPTSHITVRKWPTGPVAELGRDFAVLELSPTSESNNLWVYCTAGTGVTENDAQRYEFALFSPSADERHVETLTMLYHYHRFQSRLGLGHIVNIGHPWVEGSRCDRLLMSLPYPFGPRLEWLRTDLVTIQLVWALPITPQEALFVKQNGVEELERRFDSAKLEYWDARRQSIV